jgi:Zn-dependent peptidase ImmA (M78 family)
MDILTLKSGKSEFIVPHLTTRDIDEKIEDIFSEHYPAKTIPIDIERILDFGLHISYIPIPNLYNNHGFESFVDSKFTKIYIDEYKFDKYPERTRLTLAHELGHLILHKDFYKQNQVNKTDDYIRVENLISGKGSQILESQAFIFAYNILMPKDIFIRQAKTYLKTFGNLEDTHPKDLISVAKKLRTDFKMSASATMIRIERLLPQYYALLSELG